jgi:hypothetical protein
MPPLPNDIRNSLARHGNYTYSVPLIVEGLLRRMKGVPNCSKSAPPFTHPVPNLRAPRDNQWSRLEVKNPREYRGPGISNGKAVYALRKKILISPGHRDMIMTRLEERRLNGIEEEGEVYHIQDKTRLIEVFLHLTRDQLRRAGRYKSREVTADCQTSLGTGGTREQGAQDGIQTHASRLEECEKVPDKILLLSS